MEDVTDRIMEGTEGLSGAEYSRKIDENGKKSQIFVDESALAWYG